MDCSYVNGSDSMIRQAIGTIVQQNYKRTIVHPFNYEHEKIGNKEEIYRNDISRKPASDCSIL